MFVIRNINSTFKFYNKIVKIHRYCTQYEKSVLPAKYSQLHEIKEQYFLDRKDLSETEWSGVRKKLITNYKHINEKNIDAIILGLCNDSKNLTLAQSFIRSISVAGKEPNIATLGKLLRLYNEEYHRKGGKADSLSQEEQIEIINIYKMIKSKYEILDYHTCENVIYGLVTTQNWTDAIDLLDMMNVTTKPSLTAYSEIIVKCFSMNQIDVGWKLLLEMVDNRKQPKCDIFIAYIDGILANMSTFTYNFEKLLKFLKTYNVIITEKVIEHINAIAIMHPELLRTTKTEIKQFGKCSTCNNCLPNVSISEDDYKKLRDCFLDKVLIGQDIFQKSSPEEVRDFLRFVEKTGPFDCVIDGLNVAYSKGTKKSFQSPAYLLSSVVKFFVNKRKHVLVLGRKHMNNWPKAAMKYIKENSALFLANDLSQDDPFLLYGTLKSGLTTDFFSRDLMRQHAFLLGPDLKPIFWRWQQEHQYSLLTQLDSGKIIVKEPIRHLLSASKVENYWHIPYKQEFVHNANESVDIPEYWLCLKVLK